MPKTIHIYTDGACSGNQNETNIGGWGAVLEYGSHRKELFGGERDTTNNRMEMLALLNALKALKEDALVIQVFSDSSYVINCFREGWYKNWRRNNWMTSNKTPVENKDLWEALLAEVEKHTVSFFRVKGHVNLKNKNTNVKAHYKKFLEWNGSSFSQEDFIYVTEQNNRADALANMGIDQIRGNASS